MALEITDKNFKEVVLDSDKPVLVDFWATWCGPCRMVGPIVDELSNDYEGRAVVGKVNVDDNSAVPSEYGIRNIPALLIFKNGEIVDKVIGAVPKSVLAEKEALSARLSKLDTGFVSEKENRIKAGMEAAVAKLAKAREESDLKAEVAASAEISRLGYEEARLADLKARQVERKAETPVPQQQIQQEVDVPRQVDSRARDWARKNEWFNKDPIMTEGAKVIHRQLTEIEGYDPNTEPEEYYSEVDRRIRLEFPHKFDTNVTQESTRPTQTVASATRANRSSGRKIVKLTPSQVAIAKKLGVPLKDYAEQLKITEGV